MDLNELCNRAYANSIAKGFHAHDADNAEYARIGLRLALVHSEVSEALEELRLPEFSRDAFLDEMADILIRVGDICASFDADMDAITAAKMDYNETRPPRHGKRF